MLERVVSSFPEDLLNLRTETASPALQADSLPLSREGGPCHKRGKEVASLLKGRPAVKNLPANAGDTGSIPGWRRSPGGGKDNPL